MITAEKVISEALSWDGYCEKKNTSNLGDKTPAGKIVNAGENNYTIFAKHLGDLTGRKDIYPQGGQWCDMFCDDTLLRVCIEELGTEKGIAKCKQLLGGWSAYTPTSAGYYQKIGRWSSKPQPGAQIFFKNSTRIHHTGWVRSSDTRVYTVEGNTNSGPYVVSNGGQVRLKSYALNDPSIAGYGLPNYDANEPQLGWIKDGTTYYYRIAEGVNAHGFMDIKGADDGKMYRYYFDATGKMLTGWQLIDSKWYYFNGAGAMQTGWLMQGGVWYYLNSEMKTGWQQIGGYTYYFNDAGIMQSGWVLDGGKWYYLNNYLQTGWQQIGGSWYYLAPAMQTGWQQIDGVWYFLDAYGAMQTGWLCQNGLWYYLKSHMLTGWQSIDGRWYYFNGAGAMQSGWMQQNGIWYYLNNHMVTGWQQVSGVWYYFDGSGAMQTGWKQIGGNWYYLNNHMITGWLNLGGVWYYLDANGAMVTGSYVIGGVTYYFDENGVWIP